MGVLVVDAANVVGSRPDGWWRDRAGAARRLHDRLAAADLGEDEVVLVVEGVARAGPPPGVVGRVRTVHAPGSGDDAVVDEVVRRLPSGRLGTAGRPAPDALVVVTADRGLRARVEQAGAATRTPSWLLDRLGDPG